MPAAAPPLSLIAVARVAIAAIAAGCASRPDLASETAIPDAGRASDGGVASMDGGVSEPPPPPVCPGGFAYTAAGCGGACARDAECDATHFCAAGICRLRALEVTAAGTNTCARLVDGTVWCWGYDRGGDLGRGVATDSAPYAIPSPVRVQGLPDGDAPVAVTVGCVLLASGAVWCWGPNAVGQVGAGDFADLLVTRRVLLGGPARLLAGGRGHACAALEDATVWCWGDDFWGELGDGTFLDNPSGVEGKATPVLVAGGMVTSPIGLVAGRTYTCALLADGSVYCWGDDTNGQLGDGITQVGGRQVPRPVRAQLQLPVTMLAGGLDHACVLLATGVRCWGYDLYGQLGDGTFTRSMTPPDGKATPVDVVGLPSPVRAIFAGGNHTCALAGDGGGAYCWGWGATGQLGDRVAYTGDPQGVASPVELTVTLPAGPIALALGENHTCALLANGSVWCWGDNMFGQLGDGTFDASLEAVQVLGW